MRIVASKKSLDLIINEEVGSQPYYEKKLQGAVWPKGESGVTVGIGYDLGYNNKAQIAIDWKDYVSPAILALLQGAAGLKGEAANAYLKANPSLKAIKIPFKTAVKVFYEKTLPRYTRMTNDIYPGLDQLKPDAVGALVSMVFNRGSALKGDRRVEMKNIVPLVKSKDYAAIAAEVEKSKRLWVGTAVSGVATRRVTEAKFIRNAVREYKLDELVGVDI